MKFSLLLITFLTLATPARAANADLNSARLWQERFYWDGLLQSRDRAARVAADPAMLKVILQIAHQVAQQSANVEQISAYAKGQRDNLRFAFAQNDPGPSLEVIKGNFETLAQGTEQIRNNLYYLTTRIRMASSQALPDPKLTEKATLLIAQVQNVQLKLNALYTYAAEVDRDVQADNWAADEFFKFRSTYLLRSVVSVQDSVFSVYNASYELYVLSRA
jgi:hypothetical protein